jgi:hypothetical protein
VTEPGPNVVQSSVAVGGVHVTTAPQVPIALLTEMFDGHPVITGAVFTGATAKILAVPFPQLFEGVIVIFPDEGDELKVTFTELVP